MEEKMNSIEQQDHNDSESERAADDPELDSTDFAHPAWWRGNDRGVEAACECIASILDGTSTGPFTFGSAKLCEVAERIAALQARAAEAERRFPKVLKETRPRVLVDSHGVAWRYLSATSPQNYGRLQYRERDSTIWDDELRAGSPGPTPERIRLWNQLLDNPTEEVEM
jgi:hypothetical protein